MDAFDALSWLDRIWNRSEYSDRDLSESYTTAFMGANSLEVAKCWEEAADKMDADAK